MIGCSGKLQYAGEVTLKCYNQNIALRSCPEKAGKIILPRNYTPNALYLGYSSDSNHFRFIKNLIKQLKETKTYIKVNILIPRKEIEEAHALFQYSFTKDDINLLNFIPSVSDETIWMQDYFELVTNTQSGRMAFLDLPYSDREGELIPASLSLTCREPLIRQPGFADEETGNGDYGGNVEAFTEKVLVVGNNMHQDNFNHIKRVVDQKVIKIDVSWLETGHVDEIFSMIPHTENAQTCDQAIAYTSPKLGLELIDKMTKQERKRLNPIPAFVAKEGEEDWPDYYSCLKDSTAPQCKMFKKANLKYDQIIMKNLKIIQDEIYAQHKCRLKTLALPQVFGPLKKQKIYGGDDRAIAVNENAVNNILVYPHIFLPWQTIPRFQSYIEDSLKKFPYRVHFTNSEFAHSLIGGIHCASSVAYGCSP